jgi:spore germination protein GerM
MGEKMAFNTIVEDSRRMNARMIAMGQSIDIQKMPRPKVGTQAAQKQAMFTPEGTEIEKMLYPKNFKPRTFEAQNDSTIIPPKTNTEELVNKAMAEQETNGQKIISNYEENTTIIEAKQPEETEPEKLMEKCFMPAWKKCKYYKEQGNRAFCREYLGWCAKEKCSRPKL